MASADSGRKSFAGELSTVRSNCGGVIWLPSLKSGVLSSLGLAVDLQDAEAPGGTSRLSGTNRAIFQHGDGSVLELWFALAGGDNDTCTLRLNGLSPQVLRASGQVKSRMFFRDPLLECTITASTMVGAGTPAGSPPSIVPATYRFADTISVAWDRCPRRAIVRGPRDPNGVLQAADNQAVQLWMDGVAHPEYEIEVGAMTGSATDLMVGYRWVSAL